MEDQGIMALPQAGMQAPTAQPDLAQGLSAIEASRNSVSPEQFSRQSMEALSESDPAAAQQFIDAISGLNLPPEIIDALGQMVDAILAEPDKYQEIRAEFIREGVPEEILPPEFDPAYFGALNVALDQMSMSAAPQQFAAGGIASLNPIAAGLSRMGRNGDTMLAHITPSEARMLRRYGGSGTINPVTGLPEFFFKSVAKAVGNAFKSVGKVVSNTVKNVGNAIKSVASSTVGRIVLTAAAIYFGGPMVSSWLAANAPALAAYSTGITSALVNTGISLASGQSLKDSLKQGAIAGVTAQAIQFGVDKLGGPPTTAPKVAGAPTPDTAALTDIGVPPPSTSPLALPEVTTPSISEMATSGAPTVTSPVVSADQVINYPGSTIGEGVDVASFRPTTTMSDAGAGIRVPSSLADVAMPPDVASGQFADQAIRQAGFEYNPAGGPLVQNMPPDVASGQFADQAIRQAGYQYNPAGGPLMPVQSNVPYQLTSDYMNLMDPAQVGGGAPLPADVVYKTNVSGQPGFFQQVGQGDISGAAKTAYRNVMDFYNPQPSQADIIDVMNRDLASRASAGIDVSSEAARNAAYERALKASQPMFGTTSRVLGTGLGVAGLSGAFTPKEPGRPGIVPKETGVDLLRNQPGVYGTTPGGAQVTYASLPVGYGYAPSQMLYRPQFVFGNPYYQPRFFAQGGVAALAPSRYNTGGYAKGGNPKNFPRRVGPISGPGTETSDDIPAMLSDGEFVMTAKAVRGAGKGSRREGAKRMYAMMRKLERMA